MSLPFDSILFLRDSTRAVERVSPDICSMTFPECVIVIVIFQSSNLSSVLTQPSAEDTLQPQRCARRIVTNCNIQTTEVKKYFFF